jgi:hypothetical protein
MPILRRVVAMHHRRDAFTESVMIFFLWHLQRLLRACLADEFINDMVCTERRQYTIVGSLCTFCEMRGLE